MSGAQPSDRLEPADLAALQLAMSQAETAAARNEAADARLNLARVVLVQRYGLGAHDTLDMQTGVIVRAPAEGTSSHV